MIYKASPKSVLITGANRGIGFEIARQLAGRGISVWLTARNNQKGNAALLKLIGEKRSVRFLQLDVSDPESVHSASEKLKEQIPRLDVLVNNAGVVLRGSDNILQVSPEKLIETFCINAFGALWVTQAFADLLQNGSRVINISSGAGEICGGMSAYAPVYSITKTALNAITCQLAHSLKPQGVLVNAVCPGWVRTDMGGSSATRHVEKGAETPVWMATDPGFQDTGKFYRDKKVIPW
jgi:NAD(P)-dependent dehydrogenase (short-subunit alcohol dehydrogenase family)